MRAFGGAQCSRRGGGYVWIGEGGGSVAHRGRDGWGEVRDDWDEVMDPVLEMPTTSGRTKSIARTTQSSGKEDCELSKFVRLRSSVIFRSSPAMPDRLATVQLIASGTGRLSADQI